jgi:class 3 adenylate cyclase
MRTSILAVLFTDIEGFTERTGRQSHEENERMLRLYAALLVPVFRAFEGRLVKTIGDSFLVVFRSSTKAVLCGVAIQDRLWEYNCKVSEEMQMHVRVAINIGEVRVYKGDVFGEPVNIASRLEGITKPGEVLFTEAIYSTMNKAEIPAEDLGQRQLRGIADQVRVYHVPAEECRLRAEPAEGGPPYGNFGLMRAGKLPPADPSRLSFGIGIAAALRAANSSLVAAGRASVPHLRRAREKALVLALAWLEKARWRVQNGIARLKALPLRWQLAGAGTLVVVLAGAGILLARGGGAVHDDRAARSTKHSRSEASRHYEQGKLDEGQGSFKAAANDYTEAARQGDKHALGRLLAMTRNASCPARAAAARALGELGDPAAIPPLELLSRSTFADEGRDSVFGALFGCNSRRRARQALEKLRSQR